MPILLAATWFRPGTTTTAAFSIQANSGRNRGFAEAVASMRRVFEDPVAARAKAKILQNRIRTEYASDKIIGPAPGGPGRD